MTHKQLKLALSREESDLLDGLMNSVNPPGHEHQTFRAAVNLWANFVLAVEHGYKDSIYEYTNDLSIRDLLAEVIAACPSSLSEKLSKAVLPWDERFFAVTRIVKSPLGATKAVGGGAWWFRVPNILEGELRADLVSEGIIRGWAGD